MVAVQAAGISCITPRFANKLNVKVLSSAGQAKVSSSTNGDLLPCVYVKAYAQMKDGSTQFYKDGYTDRRGRFDYVSLSTNQLDNVSRFAILISSETHGSVVKQADPPVQ